MDNREAQNGVEIDIRHVLSAVAKKLWMILLTGCLLGSIAWGYAVFFITPTYASSVMFYVNNQYPDSPGFSSSQMTAAQELARTYMVILETRTVLEEVNSTAGLNYSYGQLRSMVSAQAVNETDVFVVTVTCTNPEDAYLLASALEQVLPAKINTEVDGSSLRMVDGAIRNNSKVGPNYTRHALLGAAIGVLLSLMVVVVADIMDSTIHSEEYLSTVYENVPLLAVIPSVDNDKNGYGSYTAKVTQTEKKGRVK